MGDFLGNQNVHPELDAYVLAEVGAVLRQKGRKTKLMGKRAQEFAKYVQKSPHIPH